MGGRLRKGDKGREAEGGSVVCEGGRGEGKLLCGGEGKDASGWREMKSVLWRRRKGWDRVEHEVRTEGRVSVLC